MIKMLVMDVDGTLTDGKIFVSDQGEVMKVFDVKDGYGIKFELKEHGIIPAIITGKISEIVAKRAAALDIAELHQNVLDKECVLREIAEKYGIALSEIAYIGDDVNDLGCIALCGFTGCPADALDPVIKQVDYVCSRNGGHSAVREFIDEIIKRNGGEKYGT